MNNEVDLARGWLVKAASDISAARLVVDGDGPYDTACFHAQQAIEKALKGFLALRKQAIPHVRLQEVVAGRQEAIRRRISERNAAFFEEEAAKLDSWADDLKVALEREIKELDRQIKEARRAASAALTLEAKLDGQKQVRALEGQRNSKRQTLFDAQDEIDHRREQLIAEIEGKLSQVAQLTALFFIKWRLI